MAASRTMKAGEVRRAKVILRLAAGQSYRAIMKQESCSQVFIARWKERFVQERLAGLYARHRGKIVSEQIIALEARILKATKQAPPDGSTHWSTRKLAGYLGVSHSRVARVWARSRHPTSSPAPLQRVRPMLGLKRFDTATVTIRSIPAGGENQETAFQPQPLTGRAT